MRCHRTAVLTDHNGPYNRCQSTEKCCGTAKMYAWGALLLHCGHFLWLIPLLLARCAHAAGSAAAVAPGADKARRPYDQGRGPGGAVRGRAAAGKNLFPQRTSFSFKFCCIARPSCARAAEIPSRIRQRRWAFTISASCDVTLLTPATLHPEYPKVRCVNLRLLQACRARGMRAPFGEGAVMFMRKQLKEWLDLSLNRCGCLDILQSDRVFAVYGIVEKSSVGHS